MRRLIAVDLFSGCGGMTLGLKNAGFSVVGAIEIDRLATETYLLNHPEVYVEPCDIQDVEPDTFARQVLGTRRRHKIDLLAACPPCQGFSTVRTLKSVTAANDHRNRLVFQVLRFVRALRPRAVLFENVPGLERDWRFRAFRRGLQRLGYTVNHYIADAANYGVAQRRRRLLLVAVHGCPTDLADVLPRNLPHKTVKQAWRGLKRVGSSGDTLHDYVERRSPTIMARIRSIPKDGGSRRDLGPSMQLQCHKSTNGFYDVYGRLAWNDVGPTITAGCINPSKGRFLHPEEDRAMTLREASLLQSFPMSYRFSMRRGRYAIAEMIGNALPPRVVERQAKAIRKLLGA